VGPPCGQGRRRRIRARILTNPKIHAPTLKVSYDGSKIVLEGVVHNQKEQQIIEDIVLNSLEGRAFEMNSTGAWVERFTQPNDTSHPWT